MKYKRREKPLESFESICNRNGIFFDKSKPYTPVKLIREDGSYCWFDANYNPFLRSSEIKTHSSLVLTDQIQLAKSENKEENKLYQIFGSQTIKHEIAMDESNNALLCTLSYQIKIDMDNTKKESICSENENVLSNKRISQSVA